MQKKKTNAKIGALLALFVLVVLMVPAPIFASESLSCSQNLIFNGSFESPQVTEHDGWDVFPSPVGPWQVEWVHSSEDPDRPIQANLEIQRSSHYAAADGDQFAELDTSWYGPGEGYNWYHPASVAIYQDIVTVPGVVYELSFYFSPKPGWTADHNRLEIRWGGALVDTQITDGSSLFDTAWSHHTYSLVAENNVTRVQFSDEGISNSLGTFIDGISLCRKDAFQPTPTPISEGGITTGGFLNSPTPSPTPIPSGTPQFSTSPVPVVEDTTPDAEVVLSGPESEAEEGKASDSQEAEDALGLATIGTLFDFACFDTPLWWWAVNLLAFGIASVLAVRYRGRFSRLVIVGTILVLMIVLLILRQSCGYEPSWLPVLMAVLAVCVHTGYRISSTGRRDA